MNKTILLFVLIISFNLSYAQGDIDSKMSTASKEISVDFKTYLSNNSLSTARLGVLDFESNSGQNTELGLFLANEFTTWLSMGTNGYTVVSRQNIDKLIDEKETVRKIRTNNEKIEVIQRYSICDYLVLGIITQFTTSYRVNVRILSTKKGQEGNVVAVKIINFERTTDLDKLFGGTQSVASTTTITTSTPTVTKPTETTTPPQDKTKVEKYKIGSTQEGILYGRTKFINEGNYLAIVKIGTDIFQVSGIPSSSTAASLNLQIGYNRTVNIMFKVTGENTGKYLSHQVEPNPASKIKLVGED